ncbi:MLP-like protein 43 [Bienertia sinuspersici]
MGVLGKMEAIVDIKSSGDVFHELYSCKPHHISNITPHKIHGCDVHEGEYGQPGCVVVWDYTIGNFSILDFSIFLLLVISPILYL